MSQDGIDAAKPPPFSLSFSPYIISYIPLTSSTIHTVWTLNLYLKANSFFLWDPGSISANSHSKPEIDKMNSYPPSGFFKAQLYLISYPITVDDNSCSCPKSGVNLDTSVFFFSVFPVPNKSSSILVNFLLLWQNTMARINLKEKVYFDLWFQRVESIIVGTTRQQAARVGNGPITFSQRIRKQSVLGVELDHELAQPIFSAVLPQQAHTPQKFSNSATPWRRHLQIHGPVGEHFLFKPQVFPVSEFSPVATYI